METKNYLTSFYANVGPYTTLIGPTTPNNSAQTISDFAVGDSINIHIQGQGWGGGTWTLKNGNGGTVSSYSYSVAVPGANRTYVVTGLNNDTTLTQRVSASGSGITTAHPNWGITCTPGNPDADGDGVNDAADNCPATANTDQADNDLDGIGNVCDGDVCDNDDDNDFVIDVEDNCPLAANTDQTDTDGDGIGDACNSRIDADGDNWSDTLDNCPNVANGDQADLDGDSLGDACDSDVDGDGVANAVDNCAATPQGILNDANGCTVDQLCPCEGPSGTTTSWKNHGKYVSCVAHAANSIRDAGLISDSEHGAIVSEAGQSRCGAKK